ncbi:hypothetical protein REPUB_Repub12eG0031400 [Reevesia pubescens]
MKLESGRAERQYGKWLRVDGLRSPGDRFEARCLSVSFASLSNGDLNKENRAQRVESHFSSPLHRVEDQPLEEVNNHTLCNRRTLATIDQNQRLEVINSIGKGNGVASSSKQKVVSSNDPMENMTQKNIVVTGDLMGPGELFASRPFVDQSFGTKSSLVVQKASTGFMSEPSGARASQSTGLFGLERPIS